MIEFIVCFIMHTKFYKVHVYNLQLIRAGQENAAGVSLEVVKELPQLQEKEQSRGRFGSGGGFSRGRGGGGGFSHGGRGGRNDRFSRGSGGGRGGYKKW